MAVKESVKIEIDLTIEHKPDGKSYIKKFNTSEMPCDLAFDIMMAIRAAVAEYFKKEEKQ